MQSVRGERFFLPLDDDVQAAESIERKASGALPAALVHDVLERAPGTAAARAPAPPKPKATATGFPEHRKRVKQSLFKQERQGAGASAGAGNTTAAQSRPGGGDTLSFEQADRLRIDRENRDRLRDMSPAAIERERAELFAGLSPALIERLLKRSTIQEDQPATRPADTSNKDETTEAAAAAAAPKKVSFAEVEHHTQDVPHQPVDAVHTELDEAGPPVPADPATIIAGQLPQMHFPQPPEGPELDPSSDSFLTDLHEKYFPNLAHDPSKLSWMQPDPGRDTASPYHPSQLALPAAALRFDFRGRLLPPNLARQIPVTRGLHHHGDAPEAAGYTVPELARLARSSNGPQRCIAFQTAGRVLYRLGAGEFGSEADELDEVAALSCGLWDAVEESGILQAMTLEAARESGHLSARAYAQEALWNWRRGGGRKRRAQ